jgi:hypothetical protein
MWGLRLINGYLIGRADKNFAALDPFIVVYEQIFNAYH